MLNDQLDDAQFAGHMKRLTEEQGPLLLTTPTEVDPRKLLTNIGTMSSQALVIARRLQTELLTGNGVVESLTEALSRAEALSAITATFCEAATRVQHKAQ